MRRSDRVAVTLSPAMRIALDLLAERSGLAASTQGMVLMRAALDRTIHSAECQERIRKARANFTVADRVYDATSDRLVENNLQRARLDGTDGSKETP